MVWGGGAGFYEVGSDGEWDDACALCGIFFHRIVHGHAAQFACLQVYPADAFDVFIFPRQFQHVPAHVAADAADEYLHHIALLLDGQPELFQHLRHLRAVRGFQPVSYTHSTLPTLGLS